MVEISNTSSTPTVLFGKKEAFLFALPLAQLRIERDSNPKTQVPRSYSISMPSFVVSVYKLLRSIPERCCTTVLEYDFRTSYSTSRTVHCTEKNCCTVRPTRFQGWCRRGQADSVRAAQLYERAITEGNDCHAMASLSLMLRAVDKGVERSVERAVDLFEHMPGPI